MARLRDRIPDTVVLTDKISLALQAHWENFLSQTEVARTKTNTSLHLVLLTVGVFLVESLFLILWSAQNLVTAIVRLAAVATLLYLLMKVRVWVQRKRNFICTLNAALMPMCTDLFQYTCTFAGVGMKDEQIRQQLVTSALLSTDGLIVKTDDSFIATKSDEPAQIAFHEILVTVREQGGDKRGQTEYEMFRGMFVVASLPFVHEAETYISTDGDRYGFAHQTFWKNLFGLSSVTVTELESNDFEKVLHVASSNHVAARELLSPEVMAHVYDWWQEHKCNMRIAIKDQYLYLLLPERKTQINSATTSAEPAKVQEYATSFMRPIWRSLVLIEGVSK